ncbi:MAG: succinylglutamate desuccinylase/aspartoacylase family protein, partial [bacterium]|nr:succinylglutamate desuccinylase/aspartoacylase family protein [bacterium]
MKSSKYTFKTDPPVRLPVIRFKGKKKGPTGFLSAGMHGDELNGMILVKKFVEDFIAKDLEKVM